MSKAKPSTRKAKPSSENAKRRKVTPKAEADDARRRIIAASDPDRKVEIFRGMTDPARRIYQAQSHRDAAVAGKYITTGFLVAPEAWAPFREHFDAVRSEITSVGGGLPLRVVSRLNSAMRELGRLERAVLVLLAARADAPSAAKLHAAIGTTGGRPMALLRRVIVAALRGWRWNGAGDALRKRLDRRVPKPWALPAGVREVEPTDNGLVIVRSQGNRQTHQWSRVEAVALESSRAPKPGVSRGAG